MFSAHHLHHQQEQPSGGGDADDEFLEADWSFPSYELGSDQRKPELNKNSSRAANRGKKGKAPVIIAAEANSTALDTPMPPPPSNDDSSNGDTSRVGGGYGGGYVQLRAKRGQATSSHSLAERMRRKKISERMKLLQDLVPNCGKVTGKAVMLDEIINYVQSLQRQVEFLSMKLATVNPDHLGFSIEQLLMSQDRITTAQFCHFDKGMIGGNVFAFNGSVGLPETMGHPAMFSAATAMNPMPGGWEAALHVAPCMELITDMEEEEETAGGGAVKSE